MSIYFLDICPTNKCGLCNQLYSIIAGIKYCIENKFETMVIKQFLKSIDSNNYCDISDIININKYNNCLRSNNIDVLLVDYSKFVSLSDNKNPKFQSNFKYQQDDLFFNLLRNIPFSTKLIDNFLTNNNQIFTLSNNINNTNNTNNNNINNININTIHLRIEDDVLTHYESRLNIDKELLRIIVENKYVSLIEKYFNKDDLIIILTYSLNNSVIDFLNNNGYKYIINEKKSNDREISAIYDLMLGEYCNNYYICVWESSYSYTLFSRINKKNSVKAIQIYYEDLDKREDFVSLLF